jgi:hypothetical protein
MLIKKFNQPVGPDAEFTARIGPVGHPVAAHAKTATAPGRTTIDSSSEKISAIPVEHLEDKGCRAGAGGICPGSTLPTNVWRGDIELDDRGPENEYVLTHVIHDLVTCLLQLLDEHLHEQIGYIAFDTFDIAGPNVSASAAILVSLPVAAKRDVRLRDADPPKYAEIGVRIDIGDCGVAVLDRDQTLPVRIRVMVGSTCKSRH